MPVAAFSVDPETLRKFKLWFKIYGVILILLGAASIILPGIATLATTITVGWLLIAGGIFGLISVFQSGSSSPGFWWNLLTAVVCVLAGGVILFNPIRGVLTLTIILAAYLLATGVTKGIMAFHYRNAIPKAWGWMLFSALVDIALGVIIFAGLPGSAIWVLGLLVGINLLFTGVALITAAIYCESANTPPAPAEPAKA
ncbi:HdeD family acid-resistance protein [Pseudorhodoplanes sp.]|uniref:HdeD family acid-resistance protein n=1 Tax=Pseudorhodoplanes sp. TaxID=1934341 RepID=UPI003D10A7C4